MSTANPFLDSVPVLYATSDRLARRTDALHRAKVSGRGEVLSYAPTWSRSGFPAATAGPGDVRAGQRLLRVPRRRPGDRPS